MAPVKQHQPLLTQPLLLFGGPYSNLQATTALKAKAAELGIAKKNIICTGDIVAYCGQPEETVDFIRQWGISVLMGNCEEAFANDAKDCGCGFDEGSDCDLLAAQWFNFANKKLRPDQRDWFAQLPRKIVLNFHGHKVQIVHGSVSRINEFVFASSPEALFRHQLQQTHADIIIAGHSGMPFCKQLGNKLWHNAGAIGMPANDGSLHTWYSTLEISDDNIIICSQQLDYDYQHARHIMIEAGLDNGYAEALISGLWPSMNILPDTEQQQRGKTLEAQTYLYSRQDLFN